MQRKIKVLQLGSASGLYGAERWILSLIKYLDPACIETHVAAIQDSEGSAPELCSQAAELGFKTHVIQTQSPFSPSAIRDLRSLIEQHEIDILHTHGYKTDFIGRLATWRQGCKIISTPHGWTESPDFKLALYEWMDRLLFAALDAVAPLSDGLHQPLQKLPWMRNKLHLIRNGVDIDEIESTDTIAKEIAELRESGTFVIGYIGRLVAGKGLDTLLRAVAEHGDPNWFVALVGEGEQELELRNLASALGIEQQIQFYGFRTDRLQFLNGFDVFALPSLSEGTPRCLMEAMVAGTPVAASDIPGCRNLIDGHSNGLLFEVGNSEQLAQQLQRIKSDSQLIATMVEQAKEFIYTHFSARRMATEYQALFLRLSTSK